MADIREVRPGTPQAVVTILQHLLADAKAGKLRGVMVFVAQHGASELSHLAGGDISIQEAGYIMRGVEWMHFREWKR